MSTTTARILKGVAGVIVVVVLLIVVSNWWGQYKSASKAAKSKAQTETTGTASSTATKTAGARVGVVLIEGLNFRQKPDSTSTTIRGFKKGEKVTIIKTEGDWYQVKDSKGVTGWVTSKSQYIKVTK